MKDYIRCLLIAIVWGILQSFDYLAIEKNVALSDLVIHSSIFCLKIVPAYLIEATFKMMPFFMFQILFGTLVYRHFCTASVYYFSRCTAKVPWFLKEIGKVALLAVTYNSFVLVVTIGLVSLYTSVQFDKAGLILAIYFIVIQSLWLFLISFLTNLVAIKLGSQNGFLLIAAVQIALMASLLLWENVLPLEDSNQIARNGFLLKWNPIAHLFLNWHTSSYTEVDRVIHQFEFPFDLNLSVFVFLAACIVAVSIGCIVIKRYDLIVLDMESE